MLTKICNVFVVIALLSSTGCDEDGPTGNGVNTCDDIRTCDTCNTIAPIGGYEDSVSIFKKFTNIYNLQIAPNQSTIAGAVSTWYGTTSIFCFDVNTNELSHVLSGSWAEWSIDGTRLLTNMGLYDIKRDHYIIDRLPFDCEFPVWSKDNSVIYLDNGRDLYSIDTTGNKLTFIASNFPFPRIVNSTTLASIYDNAIWLYSIESGTRTKIAFAELPKHHEFSISKSSNAWIRGGWDISPDGTLILADVVHDSGYTSRQDCGLFLFDLERREYHQLFQGQYWGHQFRPRWTSNVSFIASWYCRKEQSAMAYEFFLSGKTKRQITNKLQKLWL